MTSELERARMAAGLTRAELSASCEAVAIADSELLTSVSTDAIRRLEIGETKPRTKTALTLAKALHTTVEELFPLGVDAVVRNPKGVTRIAPDRPKRAMAREIRLTEKLRAMLAAQDIPYPLATNYSVHAHLEGARVIYDFAYPDVRLGIDISPPSAHPHSTPSDGWTLLLLSADEIEREPQTVMIKILNALLRLSAR